MLIVPSGCSEEEAVKPLVKAERVDPDMVLDDIDLDLELDLDLNPAFLARKEEIKWSLEDQVAPDVAAMIPLGKSMLATYGIKPEAISSDPDDPKFAVAAILIDLIETAHANGYEFVEGPLPPDIELDEFSAGAQCAIDAAGLGGFVHLAQGGISYAGLNASAVIGFLGRVTVRGAVGFVGAAWVAWEFGKCLQKAHGYKIIDGKVVFSDAEVRKQMRMIRDKIREEKGDHFVTYGDTATYIHEETNPFMICPSCEEDDNKETIW